MNKNVKRNTWSKSYDSTGEEKWQKKDEFRPIPTPPPDKSTLTGKADPLKGLSQGAQNVMPYATGLLAQSRKDATDDLSDQTFKHLGVGSEAMNVARQKLNKGRGNVDANDPQFPEAHYRTGVGYQNFNGDYPHFAATAELLRAGNCDMHAATTFTYAGAAMDKDGVAAKVVHPGHTFSELRGSNGKNEVTPKDVIVDSWAGGSHAVLRDDSYFAQAISESNDHVAHPDHTEATTTSGPGKAAYLRQNLMVAQDQPFQDYHDQQAALPVNKVDPLNPVTDGMWAETSIMSNEGRLQTSQRGYTHRKGGQMLQDLQKVTVARKMGASIGGAAKFVNDGKKK
jgi:hypothetical protein